MRKGGSEEDEVKKMEAEIKKGGAASKGGQN
jgi:hypothetical protein